MNIRFIACIVGALLLNTGQAQHKKSVELFIKAGPMANFGNYKTGMGKYALGTAGLGAGLGATYWHNNHIGTGISLNYYLMPVDAAKAATAILNSHPTAATVRVEADACQAASAAATLTYRFMAGKQFSILPGIQAGAVYLSMPAISETLATAPITKNTLSKAGGTGILLGAGIAAQYTWGQKWIAGISADYTALPTRIKMKENGNQTTHSQNLGQLAAGLKLGFIL